ncbi:hypothetical protein LJC63_09600 [Ruminococcaceae bacterium OttesenSCG-928-L11]|nr:hypothetical protein [Ruminococcaceae bacterium OttesenSCG-928-L11]
MPAKLIVCPNCFEKHPPEEFAFACTKTGCGREGTTIPPAEVLIQGGKPLCPSCRSHLSERLCPSCGYAIIAEDDTVPSVPISIVGAEGSGKSNYLSVSIDQIRRNLSKHYDCSLYPLGGDDTIKHYETRYYQPLFVKGQCINSTQQEEVTPLLYSLIFSGSPMAGRSCNLTFYDACGANFKSERVMSDYNRSVYNARGILFFVDPFQIASVRDNVRSTGRQVSNEDAATLLARTIHLIRQGGGRKNIRRKIDIPIAVCLTKADTIRGLLDPSSFILYPSRHTKHRRFDLPDHNSTSLEVKSLLESWGEVEIVNQVTSQFSDYAFFALSSLGSPPTENNSINHISPHRVLDPLLWVLWRNRIIQAGA